MRYSNQIWFCQTCGSEQNRPIANAAYHARVCSKRCWHEWEWRRTLSLMGNDYYPDPREYDSDGDVVHKGM